MELKLTKRPLGGYFVLHHGTTIGWVVRRGDWKAYTAGHTLHEDGRPVGSFSTRREAVDEVYIWRNWVVA